MRLNIDRSKLPIRLTNGMLIDVEKTSVGERNAIVILTSGRIVQITIESPIQRLSIGSLNRLDHLLQNIISVDPDQIPDIATNMLGSIERHLRSVKEPVCRCRIMAVFGPRQVAKQLQALRHRDDVVLTSTRRHCPHCDRFDQHHIIHPIPADTLESRGIATFTRNDRRRILDVTGYRDPFNLTLISDPQIDHRCPVIRLGNHRPPTPGKMTDQEIEDTFQTLSRSDNKRKAEACIRCLRIGKRGCPLGEEGEETFTSGGPNWDPEVPQTGPGAERGCRGCGWFDVRGLLEGKRLAGTS